MQEAKSIATPVDASSKLMKATEEDELFDRKMYQSAVGSLLYMSVSTRPDIAFAVGNVAKFSANPTRRHWTGMKRIFRYLKGTSDLGLYNQSAISMAQNTQFHGRTKHIDIRHHFVCEKVNNGTINLKYCPTDRMLADILTKGLPRPVFEILRKKAEIIPIPDSFS